MPLATPEFVRAEAAAGHVVGDHSWDHTYPRDVPWTKAYLRDQFGRTATKERALTDQPVCLLRPPGGFEPKSLAPVAHELGMSVFTWSVDPQDWRQPGHRSASTSTASPPRPGPAGCTTRSCCCTRVRPATGRPCRLIGATPSPRYRRSSTGTAATATGSSTLH